VEASRRLRKPKGLEEGGQTERIRVVRKGFTVEKFGCQNDCQKVKAERKSMILK